MSRSDIYKNDSILSEYIALRDNLVILVKSIGLDYYFVKIDEDEVSSFRVWPIFSKSLYTLVDKMYTKWYTLYTF